MGRSLCGNVQLLIGGDRCNPKSRCPSFVHALWTKSPNREGRETGKRSSSQSRYGALKRSIQADGGGTHPKRCRAFEISTCSEPSRRYACAPLPARCTPRRSRLTGTGKSRAGRPIAFALLRIMSAVENSIPKIPRIPSNSMIPPESSFLTVSYHPRPKQRGFCWQHRRGPPNRSPGPSWQEHT